MEFTFPVYKMVGGWWTVSKCQNHKEDGANFCGLLRKAELYRQGTSYSSYFIAEVWQNLYPGSYHMLYQLTLRDISIWVRTQLLRKSTSRPNICFITNFIAFWDGGNGARQNALLNITFSEFPNIVCGQTSDPTLEQTEPFGTFSLQQKGRDLER